MKSVRAWVVALLVLAFLASAGARSLAQWGRARIAPHQPWRNEQAVALGRMNSYAIALLLGGLRGPLVMMLWSTSESQKSARQLETFDTKVEWIRMLQPEFDSVHIFQIWNKAYNISAQMASLANKYATILDAIDYARSVERERPDNMTIAAELGRVYFDKLGNSAERHYYRQRVRDETRSATTRVILPVGRMQEFREAARALGADTGRWTTSISEQTGLASTTIDTALAVALQERFGEPDFRYVARQPDEVTQARAGWRRAEHDILLDATGRLLPGAAERYPHLRQFEPFPYGVSVFAIAWHYMLQSRELMEQGQKHVQLNDMIVDSRTPLALRNWAEEEWLRARNAEFRVLGLERAIEIIPMELQSADVPPTPDQIRAPQAMAEALHSYGQATRLARMAVQDYRRHLQRYSFNVTTYASHILFMESLAAELEADASYLRAMISFGAQRTTMLQAAAEAYRRALRGHQLSILRHYTHDEILLAILPLGMGKADLEHLRPEQLAEAVARRPAVMERYPWDPHVDDYEDFAAHVQRCQTRLSLLQQTR